MAQRYAPSCNVDLTSLLTTDEFADLTLLDGPGKEKIKSHRAILSVRSPFFRAACKELYKGGQAKEIFLPEIDVSTMKNIRLWMYGGPLNTDLKRKAMASLITAADFLQLDELADQISKYFQGIEKDIRRCLDWFEILGQFATTDQRKWKLWEITEGFVGCRNPSQIVGCFSHMGRDSSTGLFYMNLALAIRRFHVCQTPIPVAMASLKR